MRSFIIMLTILLIAVTYTLSISQTQATSLHMHELTFADTDGQILFTEDFVEGADFSAYQLPDGPAKEGYIFLGWSYDFTQVMPNADMIVYPQYLCAQYNIPATIK